MCTGGAVIFLTMFAPTELYEDDLKYGDRDIASGSLVFPCSKDKEAYGEPLPESIYNHKTLIYQIKNLIKKSQSVHQLQTKDVYIVASCWQPRYLRKRSVILMKSI